MNITSKNKHVEHKQSVAGKGLCAAVITSFVVPAGIVDLLRKVPFALDGEYLNEAKSVCFLKDGRGGPV